MTSSLHWLQVLPFDAHTVAFAAVQEFWTAQEEMLLPWRISRDNQLNVNYRIPF